MQDLVSDFIARYNNGIRADKESVVVKKNRLVEEICKKLVIKNFLESFKEVDQFHLVITYKSTLPFHPVLKRVSKPGRRFYTKKNSFPRIQDGFGYNLVTTSQGIKTHLECLRDGLGGEVILQAIKASKLN